MDDPKTNEDFIRLLLAHEARLYAFIISLLRDPVQAEDILQETGLVLFRRFNEFRPGTNFYAWACRIALYKVLDYRKRTARSPLVMWDPELMETIAEEQINRADELERRAHALELCLQKLRAEDRDLVERCYQTRVFVKDVARTLQCPADTIYKRLRRIRGLLHACITRRLSEET